MPAHTKRRRVLLVEDSEGQRALLTRLLEREGYEILAVDNGAKGLSAADASIDVVLLDIAMPGLNGLDVCRQLRGDPATANLPIILLTGRTDSRDVRDGLLAGADAFLSKPVEIDALLSAVAWLSDGRPEAGRPERRQTAPPGGPAETLADAGS